MIKVATVFSGIGAFEQALIKKNIDHEIVFACDSGERYLEDDLFNSLKDLDSSEKKKFVDAAYEQTKKTNYVKKSYFSNYNINGEQWHNDVRFLDTRNYKGKIDIFVGGSPCQSFSIIGKKAGLQDSRGTLFYEFARIVNESQPKVFIYENVTGLLNHDKGKTWKVIKDIFDSLNYNIYYDVLNSVNYGIPQNRKRVFVVGIRKDLHNKQFEFPEEQELTKNLDDYLEKNCDVDHLHYLGKKGFEFVTNPKYKNRARVNKKIIQTQKANQQYNWNGDFVFVNVDEIINNNAIMERAYIGEYKGVKGAIRQLTNRECLRLMGFPDSFIINVPRQQSYRQAGNSIVVTIFESLIESVFKVVKFDE